MSLRESVFPVSDRTSFYNSGQLTPAEFIAAGEFLQHRFPTWTWESGDSKHQREFLPAEKQYLVTRNGMYISVCINLVLKYSALPSTRNRVSR